ncbi:H-NS family nucleoid-associated regulatory protein [Halomonas sp. 3A7M]|uniref:H-NS family nucleoid-associated regulatory protein n=1 Tax=Halomonas sp. 3A7M TaxID=2742616 RepID=UPI00186860F4|nr:H-NS family nucleoid-associated regulatory protein [Halomonas sp. 3A7M]
MTRLNIQKMSTEQLTELMQRINAELEHRALEAEPKSALDADNDADNADVTGGVAYRNPDDPWQVWRPGRGRRPNWVNEWLESGRKLEELEDGDAK